MSDPAEGTDAWKAQNKGPMILGICWAVTGLSSLFVIARLYVRTRILHQLQSDDWFIIAGQICGYLSTALSTVAVAYGNGRHFTTLTTEQQEGAILWTTAAFCPGVMSFGLPKMAVIVLLTRLLNPGRHHKWFLWWLGIWCQLTLMACVGVLLGRCMPARSLWDFSVPGKCFDVMYLVNYAIYSGAFSAFCDIYLAVYPTIVLFKLQLSTRKKIALCVALGIGSISGIVAIYKTTRIPTLASPDFSYDTSDLVLWTVIEGSTIIIASSIPILQPLMELIMKRNVFSSNNKSKNGPRYYEDYSSRSKSGIELGQRKPKSKPKDDLGLTIMADEGSQEEILSPEQKPAHALGDDGWGSRPEDGKILRTKVITVSYDNGATGEHNTTNGRWGGV